MIKGDCLEVDQWLLEDGTMATQYVYTYIVAPGEHRAPLCGNTGTRGAVDTRPGLVGVYGDDGGTVGVA